MGVFREINNFRSLGRLRKYSDDGDFLIYGIAQVDLPLAHAAAANVIVVRESGTKMHVRVMPEAEYTHSFVA